jgi:large subunit ribosomal protein L25
MTTEMPSLKAEPRKAGGKGAARRLRRTGVVPAIAYGKGMPTTSIAVAPKEVQTILRSELGKNTVISLELDGKKMLAMIKDFTVHPLERYLEHIDFVEVRLDKPVDVDVPIVPIGKAIGVAEGGVLRLVYRAVPVRCLPDRIPTKIEVGVEHLKLGDGVPTKELKIPEGVAIRLPPEQTIVAVVAPEKEEVEEPVPGAVAAAVPGAVPVAGAPGAAPAPGAPAAAPAEAAPAEKKEKKEKK